MFRWGQRGGSDITTPLSLHPSPAAQLAGGQEDGARLHRGRVWGGRRHGQQESHAVAAATPLLPLTGSSQVSAGGLGKGGHPIRLCSDGRVEELTWPATLQGPGCHALLCQPGQQEKGGAAPSYLPPPPCCCPPETLPASLPKEPRQMCRQGRQEGCSSNLGTSGCAVVAWPAQKSLAGGI